MLLHGRYLQNATPEAEDPRAAQNERPRENHTLKQEMENENELGS